jgi:hypothetical protein
MTTRSLRTTTVLVAAALIIALVLLCQSARAQTANQWYFQKKNTGAGFTGYGVTPISGRAFGLDGSGNPAMLSVSGGSGLENILSSITGDTLTFTGSLTAPRAIAWRDLAGTVAFTSDLAAYLTTATAATTYAPLASPTFTGTVTIPSGASISGYATTAAIASGYQPLDSDLTAIAGLTSAADRLPYYTGDGTAALATFTSTARSLLDDSSTSAMRGTLGLGSMATQSNASVSITGGDILGVTLGVIGIGVGSTGIAIEDPLNGSNITTIYGASGASPTLYFPSTGTVLLSNLSSLNADNISSGTVAPARLGSGSSITTKYLRGDGTWQTISGGGDALTSGNLSQFAATTSSQLRGVLSDESGTGDFLTTNGSAASLTSFPTLNQSTTGNAGTATALQTGRAINGVTFDGTAAITVTADAGTLTGTTLNATVTGSSLTSLGTIATGVWQGTAIGDSYISSATTWNAKEAALTFSTGLTRTTNTITVNTSQNIATLSNLTSNGFVKTSGGTGALSIDTATYLTTTGNGSSLTGITQSQVSGLTTTDRPQFANVRSTHSTLTYAATTDIDMDNDGFQTVTLTGNVTFTTSNRAAGRSKTVRIVGDSSLRTFTFPGWTFVGAAAPASLAANKDAILTITAFGTADTDIVAAYAVEP